PQPANGATVGTSVTLTWSAAGATSYDVRFGTANPPPAVSTNQAAASYTPSGLQANRTYFWQIVARNAQGSTTGPVWSFSTGSAPPTPPEVVLYASDVPASALHGSWATASDSASPNGVALATTDTGF